MTGHLGPKLLTGALCVGWLVALGCSGDGTSTAIDRRSYNLGGIGAFAESAGDVRARIALVPS